MTADSIFLKSLKNDSGLLTRIVTGKGRENLNVIQKSKRGRPRRKTDKPSVEPTKSSKTANEIVTDGLKGAKITVKGQMHSAKGHLKGQSKSQA